MSIILTCMASVFVFDAHPTGAFLLGTVLVLCSLFLYAFSRLAMARLCTPLRPGGHDQRLHRSVHEGARRASI